jgi:Domain of unknown function (DUF3291)
MLERERMIKLTTNNRFFVAEFNIARLRAKLDSPIMKEFVDFLDPVNRFAEQSPGFVWRLTADNGAGSSYLPSPYADEMMITNLSVWEDIESLQTFTYQTVHHYFLKSRKKWFEQFAGHQLVLWWIVQGTIPTLAEAQQKLQSLEAHGPSPAAFTLQSLFDSQGQPMKRTKSQQQTA